MKKKSVKKRTEKSMAGWYFLIIVLFIYIIIAFFNKNIAIEALASTFLIIKRIFFVFILVYFLLVIINYFIKPRHLTKYMGKGSGIKGWIIAIITGILSSGPIYMWYPLLNELQKQGVRNGLIATFLYNRAVKLALLPLIIYYFGLKYTIILTFVMIFVSIIQGILIDKIVEVRE